MPLAADSVFDQSSAVTVTRLSRAIDAADLSGISVGPGAAPPEAAALVSKAFVGDAMLRVERSPKFAAPDLSPGRELLRNALPLDVSSAWREAPSGLRFFRFRYVVDGEFSEGRVTAYLAPPEHFARQRYPRVGTPVGVRN